MFKRKHLPLQPQSEMNALLAQLVEQLTLNQWGPGFESLRAYEKRLPLW